MTTQETQEILQARYSEVRTNILYDIWGIASGFEQRFPEVMLSPRDIQAMGELHRALVALSYGLPAPEGEGG